ncbi:hypothetical protein PTKIN_Ptkin16aG0022700 [Pterospermum kingtungense]
MAVEEEQTEGVEGGVVDDLSPDLVHGAQCKFDVGKSEFSLLLSEREMIGVENGPLFSCSEFAPQSVSVVNETLSNNVSEESSVQGSSITGNESNIGLALIPFTGPTFLNGNEDNVGDSTTSGRRRAKAGRKILGQSRRKLKQPKKKVNKLVYGCNFIDGNLSTESLSDEDIRNKNNMIIKEAEVDWEVGEILGFNFVRNHIQMVEVFDQLEDGGVRWSRGSGTVCCFRRFSFNFSS